LNRRWAAGATARPSKKGCIATLAARLRRAGRRTSIDRVGAAVYSGWSSGPSHSTAALTRSIEVLMGGDERLTSRRCAHSRSRRRAAAPPLERRSEAYRPRSRGGSAMKARPSCRRLQFGATPKYARLRWPLPLPSRRAAIVVVNRRIRAALHALDLLPARTAALDRRGARRPLRVAGAVASRAADAVRWATARGEEPVSIILDDASPDGATKRSRRSSDLSTRSAPCESTAEARSAPRVRAGVGLRQWVGAGVRGE
jgi:hypothetical protein